MPLKAIAEEKADVLDKTILAKFQKLHVPCPKNQIQVGLGLALRARFIFGAKTLFGALCFYFKKVQLLSVLVSEEAVRLI